jgi:hypothetical protein
MVSLQWDFPRKAFGGRISEPALAKSTLANAALIVRQSTEFGVSL